MTPPDDAYGYADAVDDAFDRLRDVGFEFGPGFAVHAPMAAEALATLGHCEAVPSWIEAIRRKRRSYGMPAPYEPIPGDDPAHWRAALGDYARITDWVVFFERRLEDEPWDQVLVDWWPRLLGGVFAAFTHGLIRTAHVVRTLRATPVPSENQLRELARALAYWAARYMPVPVAPGLEVRTLTDAEDVPSALSEVTAAAAGRYAERAPRPAVPLLHSITAPAAIRLVLPCLPPELRLRSFEAAQRLAAAPWLLRPERSSHAVTGPPPSDDRLVATAVELGDEHAIKIVEVARRENALNPDGRYAAAAHTLLSLYGHSPI